MGPWARSFLAALAGRAERPALEVADLRIDPGVITARVEECEVSISATVIPPRIWRVVESYTDATVQSVHLEHVLEEDWEELLVPRPRSIQRSCSCDGEDCEHVVAAAWAFADAIESRPRVLLHWRGIDGGERPASVVADPWRGGELPEIPAPRQFPRYAVLERLGPSGVEVQGEEFASVLRRAYDRFPG